MKKLILAAVLMAGMTGFAQERTDKPKREKEHLTVEQRSQLRLKELTLKLDLNASQQKEFSKIITETEAKREAAIAAHKARKEDGKKPTAEERFAMKNKFLDEQIAMKEKVKKILNADQFAKWEKMKEDRRERFEKVKSRKLQKQRKIRNKK